MATKLLDLFVVLLWPLVLSAAAWRIVINALAETDEISKVVDALTRPNGVEENATCGEVSPRRSTLSALGRTPHTAPNISRAIGRAMERKLLRGSDHRGERASVTRILRDDGLAEYPSPVAAPPALRTALAVLLVANFIAAAPPAHARRFEFDQRRTEVRFVYKMAYSTQRGRFTKVSGTLDYDEAAPEKAKINASIAAASLTTGEALVDNELKGAAFFNVTASPVVAFKSLAVSPRSATQADVTGEITINGITKPVTLNVSLKPHDDPALKWDVGAHEFIGTTRILRSAFNMTDYQSMVDDEIDIEIAAIVRPR